MNKILHWLPALFWMGLIFYLSSRTGDQLAVMFPFVQNFNAGHFLAYFVLSSLYYYALSKTTSLQAIPFWAIFLCLMYGITDEYHQNFVATRTPDPWDLMNDAAGASASAFIIYTWQR